MQVQDSVSPILPARRSGKHSKHQAAICQYMRSQKAATQTAHHLVRPEVEAPDHDSENPANPSPRAVSRRFWRWFSKTVLRCPKVAATSGCLLPCCLRIHHPEWTPMTSHRSPGRFRAELPPGIQPAKSRGKYPRNPETCPAPRGVLRVLCPDAAALCSANGCDRLLPAHFDSPAPRPFPHPFSRRSRHRQRTIRRIVQTNRPYRHGCSSLPRAAWRAVLSRTCRSPFRKGLLLHRTERRVSHHA